MNVTFMIGNGFDIAAGLKTSYKDFIDWYLKQDSPDENIRQFKGSIRDNGPLWSDVELALGADTQLFGDNTPDSYFPAGNADDFIECYEDLHNALAQYLQQGESILTVVNEHSLYDSCRIKIENCFQHFCYDRTTESLPVGACLPSSLSTSITLPINYLVFNYTNTLEAILSPDTASILHVHGTTTRYPILGVANYDQVANQTLGKHPDFDALMIKSYSQEAIGEGWFSTAKEVIESSDVVCCFGLSFGETDLDWWNLLGDWLDASPAHRLVVYWHDKNYTPSTNSISIRKKIKRQRIPNNVLSLLKKRGIKNTSQVILVINSPQFEGALSQLAELVSDVAECSYPISSAFIT